MEKTTKRIVINVGTVYTTSAVSYEEYQALHD